jgi:hypothetical protein
MSAENIHDFESWMRQVEKRGNRANRRRQVSKASDLLGPGFGPTATQIDDWNSDTAAFNGQFWGPPGTANSPDGSFAWIGQTITSDLLNGIQRAYRFIDAGVTQEYVRRFRADTSGVRIYEAWVPTETDTGWLNTLATTGLVMAGNFTFTSVSLRRTGHTVALLLRFSNNAAITVGTNGNFTDTVVATLSSLFRPTGLPTQQALSGPVGAPVLGGFVSADGNLTISCTAPGATLPAGTAMSLGGTFLV